MVPWNVNKKTGIVFIYVTSLMGWFVPLLSSETLTSENNKAKNMIWLIDSFQICGEGKTLVFDNVQFIIEILVLVLNLKPVELFRP